MVEQLEDTSPDSAQLREENIKPVIFRNKDLLSRTRFQREVAEQATELTKINQKMFLFESTERNELNKYRRQIENLKNKLKQKSEFIAE